MMTGSIGEMEDPEKAIVASMEQSALLSVAEILKEAFMIPCRNGRLMLSVILLMLLPFFLFTVGFEFSMVCTKSDLFLKIGRLLKGDLSNQAEQDLMQQITQLSIRLLRLKVFFAFGFCIITLFSLVLTIYTSAASYVGKKMTVLDLIQQAAMMWRRPMVIFLYIVLMTLAYVCMVIILISIVVLVVRVGVLLFTPIVVVLLVSFVFYMYLGSVWMLGLVVSVVGDDGCGMEAVVKAGRLISGRRAQGLVLMSLLCLTDRGILAISVICNHGLQHRVVQSFVRIGMMCLLFTVELFFTVVFTVFYYECKKSNGEPVEIVESREYIVLNAP